MYTNTFCPIFCDKITYLNFIFCFYKYQCNFIFIDNKGCNEYRYKYLPTFNL